MLCTPPPAVSSHSIHSSKHLHFPQMLTLLPTWPMPKTWFCLSNSITTLFTIIFSNVTRRNAECLGASELQIRQVFNITTDNRYSLSLFLVYIYTYSIISLQMPISSSLRTTAIHNTTTISLTPRSHLMMSQTTRDAWSKPRKSILRLFSSKRLTIQVKYCNQSDLTTGWIPSRRSMSGLVVARVHIGPYPHGKHWREVISAKSALLSASFEAGRCMRFFCLSARVCSRRFVMSVMLL
jgi:hypothetical protein